ncbi:MAG: molybdopterin-dependent oxidoreductase [Acidobacteriaceae bacterium]
MSNKISRRRIITTGLAALSSVAGLDAAAKIADRYGLLAPDHQGIFGVGEALTYGAQRLLTSHHSMAREFSRSEISDVSPVNHGHPDYDPYQRMLFNKFKDWRLYVDGLVARPMSFSLADLKSLPSRTNITQLTCEEGWSYIAAWTGVPLALILNLVGASAKAKWIVFYPFNDFWGSIDIVEALHPQTLLAHGMNGEDLTPDHGAPIRLRIPRQLGYKNLRYIARISVTDSLKNIGDGTGSAAPEIGYSWYGGI